MQITDEVKAELERIRKAGGGILTPEAVVEASRRKKSALHDLFLWDDDAAAALRGRLDIARELIIKVKVTIITPEERSVRVRAYVSLPSDRATGNGYRRVEEVMSDPALRSEMVTAALRDLELFEARHKDLHDLVGLWDSIDHARKVLQDAAN